MGILKIIFFHRKATQKHFWSPKTYIKVGVVCLHPNYTAIDKLYLYNIYIGYIVASRWSMDDQKGQNWNSRNQQHIQKEGVCFITSK